MKKTPFTLYTHLLWAGLLFISSFVAAQSKTEKAIRSAMAAQEVAWNKGDLTGFMDGYWKSDQLRFIGSRGLTYGWDATLANYKKGYPGKAEMGTLTFTLLSVEQISRNSAYVVGQWRLERQKDNPSGHFTLLWKKIKGKWLIVSDHSS
jgi:ketosteroid isomerase-like protein